MRTNVGLTICESNEITSNEQTNHIGTRNLEKNCALGCIGRDKRIEFLFFGVFAAEWVPSTLLTKVNSKYAH